MTKEHDTFGSGSDNSANLGERVRMLRQRHGFSQQDLAAMLPGVKQQSINQLEHGLVVNPRYLPELAELFETSIEWLRTGKDGGEGAMPRMRSAIDVELMQEIVLGIQERAAEVKRPLSVQKIHALARDAYRKIRRKEILEDMLNSIFHPMARDLKEERKRKKPE